MPHAVPIRKNTVRHALLGALAAMLAACGGPSDREVASFSNDLMGNAIAIEALPDPAIPAVVCHLAYFDRSFLDRIRQGNWFENPSNSAVSCVRTGPISLAGVPLGAAGEEIFSQRQSLLFKRMALRRVVDRRNRVILYIAHSRELVEGSAKIAMSSVALNESETKSADAK
ncbi:MAG: CreA family protein [Hyphomonadaceae bacterium]